jgi:hypothetical protein
VSSIPGRRPEFNPALNLYAQAFEPGDPIAYARRVAREPSPGSVARHVLVLQTAHNDEAVPGIANESLGRAMGLSFALDTLTTYLPVHADLPTLAVTSDGVSGNAGGTTLVFQQYSGATHNFLGTQHGTRLYGDDEVFPPFDPSRTAMVTDVGGRARWGKRCSAEAPSREQKVLRRRGLQSPPGDDRRLSPQLFPHVGGVT